MIHAWLVVNEYLNNHKFNEIHEWLIEAGKRKGVQLQIYTNAELAVTLPANNNGMNTETAQNPPDFVLFLDKDIYLAKHLESSGYRLFNSSYSIEVCDDKALTHLALHPRGIPMPMTILAPKTFEAVGYGEFRFFDMVEERLSYPMVIKECFGSFGQQVYLVNNRKEAMIKITEIGSRPMLFQEFIKTSFGKDVRLQVVGGEVIASMYRYSDSGDFRANVTSGAKMSAYTPTEEQKELAIRCCKELKLDFAGVDLLFGRGGEPIVCEVNSNAHFKNIYDCTGINAADGIIQHILEHL